MPETQDQSLCEEDTLEQEMATYFSILAWEVPWTEEPGGLHAVHEVAKDSDMTQWLNNNKENTQMANKHMKDFPGSSVVKTQRPLQGLQF